ncbi:PTS sugar transporter subunit IIB [Blautia liquoris]|jgi:PTS system cellobiose-specific IIB component|uniref:PTS sugar transporter subunit IIB n=1 Tax=Blautia liquoris TaxID=2779518 RepID=A0A7M2RCU4_9FIRM|nr:PTS sugar transporter subunit IIB [Blautia liquoris]QOV18149.1 PTS sugar transporter subunit IIB [Blautia liquoris]
MIYITLVCAGGMSTSILAKKMEKEAKSQGKEVKVTAMSESAFKTYKEPTDVLLLGPQVGYILERMKKDYEPKGIKVQVIDRMAYGQINGKAVLESALALLKES